MREEEAEGREEVREEEELGDFWRLLYLFFLGEVAKGGGVRGEGGKGGGRWGRGRRGENLWQAVCFCISANDSGSSPMTVPGENVREGGGEEGENKIEGYSKRRGKV